ncbi:MAG: NUDIX hydrolase [Proteobacteria bacterium]|nr:NUDIX hydrolase [Pseudomonadota bacterium]
MSSTPLPAAARWAPRVTVAAVISDAQGRYLVVEERTARGLRLNNPAGHLEPGETLTAAVVREVLEETARPFVPEAVVGIYLARVEAPGAGVADAYLRFTFCGRVGEPEPGRVLDEPIVRTLWLTREELAADPLRLRSPMVMRSVDDHAAGRRHDLAVLGVVAPLT